MVEYYNDYVHRNSINNEVHYFDQGIKWSLCVYAIVAILSILTGTACIKSDAKNEKELTGI